MDIAISISANPMVAIAQIAGAIATVGIAITAVVQMREMRRQSRHADEALRAAHLPVLRAARPIAVDTHFFINIQNIGTGSAISPWIGVRLTWVTTAGLPHGAVMAAVDEDRAQELEHPPQLEGSADSLAARDELLDFELRANEQIRGTATSAEQLVAHWRLRYGDIFGGMHERTGSSLVNVNQQDGDGGTTSEEGQ